VLDKPLKEGSATEYRITGPWKNPDVRKLGKDDSEPASSSEAVRRP